MIPRIKTGTSFKGAGLYYLHDKRLAGENERLTKERVAWTHAVNTLEEEPGAVLAEMRQTAFNQPVLKQLAGKRLDGRPTEKTVMTVSLAWSPEEKPSRDDMIAAGLSFLQHMGWQEHQALFVAHRDTQHPHVHLVVNRVHPETGMTLDDAWSKTRAQRWALAYEREHGRVFCRAREARYGRGQAIETENMNYREWRQWQELARESALDPEYRHALESGEWQVLKQVQKQDRIGFWKETGQMRKDLRATVRKEVRDEFAPEWQAYAQTKEQRMEEAALYDKEARRAIRTYREDAVAVGQIRERQDAYHTRLREGLFEMRADIASRQKTRVEELAEPALQKLKGERAIEFKELLARQKSERDALKEDQQSGTRRHDVLARYGVDQGRQPELSRERERDFIKHARSATRRGSVDRGRRRPLTLNRSSHPDRQERQTGSIAGGHDQRSRPPRRDAGDLVVGAGLALFDKLATSLESVFEPSTTANHEDEEMSNEKAMTQQPNPPRAPQEKAVQTNEQEQEVRRRADLDFYLKQRDRERHHDRGR
jgi:relaxase-like protein